MTYFQRLAASLVGVLFLAAGCQQSDSTYTEGSTVDATPTNHGQELYVTYCQNCHGAAGLGDGPVTELLKVPPPNLATIASENNGSFPVDRLTAWIDGREGDGTHGTRQMPIWGNIWTDAEGGADVEQQVSSQISELVEYIRTLQVTDAG